MGIQEVELKAKQFVKENCLDCDEYKNKTCKEKDKLKCEKFRNYMKNNVFDLVALFMG
jgi:hypothetical protein